MPARRKPKVIRIDGPVVLEFTSGFRLKVGLVSAGASSGPSGRRRGRPTSAATQALQDALAKAAKAGKTPTRARSLDILRTAGHKGSLASAQVIARREEIRVFGRSLAGKRAAGGRKARRKAKRTGGSGKAGRKPSRETLLLRERIAADTAASSLKDPTAYIRWVVDQPGVKLGLKQVRPIVYRELNRARK